MQQQKSSTFRRCETRYLSDRLWRCETKYISEKLCQKSSDFFLNFSRFRIIAEICTNVNATFGALKSLTKFMKFWSSKRFGQKKFSASYFSHRIKYFIFFRKLFRFAITFSILYNFTSLFLTDLFFVKTSESENLFFWKIYVLTRRKTLIKQLKLLIKFFIALKFLIDMLNCRFSLESRKNQRIAAIIWNLERLSTKFDIFCENKTKLNFLFSCLTINVFDRRVFYITFASWQCYL